MEYVNRNVSYSTVGALQPLALRHRLLSGGSVLNSYSANSPAVSAALNGSDALQKTAEEDMKKKPNTKPTKGISG